MPLYDTEWWQCRKPTANVNVTEDLKSLKQHCPESCSCPTVEYSDRYNPHMPIEYNTFPSCGYNTDSERWCDKQKGDIWYREIIKQVKDKLPHDLGCHTKSPIYSCKAAWEVLGSELMLKWIQEILGLEKMNGSYFADFAENDECVKESLNSFYWTGKIIDVEDVSNLRPLLAFLKKQEVIATSS